MPFKNLYGSDGTDLEPITFKTQVGPALSELKRYLSQKFLVATSEVVEKGKNLEVIDEETSKKAVKIIARTQGLLKELEGERTTLTKPLLNFKKGVDNNFKLYSTNLDALGARLRARLTTYQARVEHEARLAQKRAEEDAARLQAELDKEAKEKGTEAPQVVVPAVPGADKVVTRTEEATASLRKDWDYELVDLSKVGREWLMLDDKKVKAALRGGLRNIDGLRIYEKPSVRVRG